MPDLVSKTCHDLLSFFLSRISFFKSTAEGKSSKLSEIISSVEKDHCMGNVPQQQLQPPLVEESNRIGDIYQVTDQVIGRGTYATVMV